MRIRKRLFYFFILIGALAFQGVTAQKAEASNPLVRVGFNCHLQPYQFQTPDGSYGGMHIEIMNAIGLEYDISLVYVPFDTNSECISALKNNEVDLILGYRIGDSLEPGLQYVDELSSGSMCMVAPKQLKDTQESRSDYGKHIAAMEYGSIHYSALAQMGFQGYRVYGNQESLCAALLAGKEETIVGLEESLQYALRKANRAQDYAVIHRYISSVRFSFLVRTEDSGLVNILSNGISELRTKGSYELIYRKWIIDSDAAIARQRLQLVLAIMIVLAAVGAVLIISNFRANALLKRKVSEKTAELNLVNQTLEQKIGQLNREYTLRNSIIENAPNGMLMFGTDYIITLCNHAARQIAEEARIGIDVRKVPVFREIIRSFSIDPSVYSADSVNSGMLEFGSFAHRKSYRFHVFCPIEHGEEEGMLLTVEDVTAEEQEKNAMHETEKSRYLNQLVAGIAHEIKNPLMSIRTAASLMLSKGKDPKVQMAFAEFVPGEVDRINRLVEGLISYAKPIRFETEIIDVSALIRDSLYLMNAVADKNNVLLELDLQPEMLICGKKDQLKQSLVNLILNSLESIEERIAIEGPENPLAISIRCFAEQENVVVIIRDEGTGMSKEQIQMCTQPFFTTKRHGNGLGLALVKQLMQASSGTMEIQSKLGEYTQITLAFRRVYYE